MRIVKLGPNKTELHLDHNVVVFFSYNTPVAAYIPSRGHVKTSKSWSRTTSKHINQWLMGLNAEEVPQEFIERLVKG